MIRCTLELIPASDPERVEHLGTIEISNDVMGTIFSEGGRRGNYKYRLFKKRRQRVFAEGKIRDFPRLSYHPWNLVRRILNEIAERNGGTI